jgi:hypothetical protein
VRIPVIIEWRGGSTGWAASAKLPDGGEITVRQAHSLLAARRRMRRALADVGVQATEFAEDLRIPKHLAAEVEAFRSQREQVSRANAELVERRTELAQRLLAELNLSEREVAEWLGISSTHLANLLQTHSTRTRERPIEGKPRGERDAG